MISKHKRLMQTQSYGRGNINATSRCQRKLKNTEIQILFMQTEKSQNIKINWTFEKYQVVHMSRIRLKI